MPSVRLTSFVDTNILVYAVDPAEPEKRRRAGDLLRSIISNETLVVSPQSLNECYRVLTDRRQIADRPLARRYVQTFERFCVAPMNVGTMFRAWTIQDEFGFSWWDSLLLAAASLAGCTTFFSEDMQAGRRIGALEIRNPFASDL